MWRACGVWWPWFSEAAWRGRQGPWGSPSHLRKVAVCQDCGILSTELKALEGLERQSPVACETHLNPSRKLGCCLLSLKPGWEVHAIWNWVVCYIVINTQRILIHNTCSFCFAKLFLNHSAFLSSCSTARQARQTSSPYYTNGITGAQRG